MGRGIFGSSQGRASEVYRLFGSVNGETKEITAVFASVNGEAKQIYPADLSGYGYLYYVNQADTPPYTMRRVAIPTAAQFNSLTFRSGSQSRRIGNVTVYNYGTGQSSNLNIIAGIDFGLSVTAIPDYFLANCPAMELMSIIVVPDTITSIGNDFMYNANRYNAPIKLSNNLATIGNNFMYRFNSFNQPLHLPQSLTSIGSYFLYELKEMVSEINVGNLSPDILTDPNTALIGMYRQSKINGVKIAGENRAAWLEALPNREDRNLVDAGH